MGYMDDPYHEETYEDLLTPSFFSLERDTLQIVEVTPALLSLRPLSEDFQISKEYAVNCTDYNISLQDGSLC